MGIAVGKWSLRRWVNRVGEVLLHWITLNHVNLGREVVLKRRNSFGRRIAPVANRFFRVCRAPIVFWREVREWQKWEVECYRMLHPGHQAIAVGEDAVCQEKLPGESLYAILKRGEMRKRMLEAAAREMRRAHSLWSEEYQGLWSHGDGTMNNVIYDAATGKAHFIDFEFTHDHSLTAEERQADDLHAFLMDLAGFVPERKWLAYALAFLRTYGDEGVIAELRRHFSTPSGVAWIWWKIRGNFVGEKKLARRFGRLALALDQGALTEGAVRERRSHRR